MLDKMLDKAAKRVQDRHVPLMLAAWMDSSWSRRLKTSNI